MRCPERGLACGAFAIACVIGLACTVDKKGTVVIPPAVGPAEPDLPGVPDAAAVTFRDGAAAVVSFRDDAAGDEGSDGSSIRIDASAAPEPIDEPPLRRDAALVPDRVADAPALPPDAPLGGASPENSISGTIRQNRFPVAVAFWIGRATTTPTRIVMLEAPAACADLSEAGWDGSREMRQILEIGVAGRTPGVYQIRRDGDASYVGPASSLEANNGTVTITAVNAGQSIRGSFELSFGPDDLTGTFAASYCATGVEP